VGRQLRQIGSLMHMLADCGLGLVPGVIVSPSEGEPPMVEKLYRTSKSTKAAKITALLLRSNGATIAELARSTDWQPHSVRGFMSGTLKKKLGFEVKSKVEVGKPRRYLITRGAS
jgi:hypothetical protein